jgi:hypothetical protein
MFVADIPNVTWPATGSWMLGLIGVLAVVNLIFGVANSARRLFAKHPPVDDQLARIESDCKREAAQASQRCETRHESIKAAMDEKFRDLALERARSIGQLHDKINTVAADVAFIRGKLSKSTE